MKPLSQHRGLVVPFDRVNVDTDAIMPKQFLKSIKRTGFGQNLFDEWRYLDHGEPGQACDNRSINPDFILNQPQYAGASVLLTRANFGCGSSREHAPWALEQYGFRVLIAPSFADIFFHNCFKNGMLPIVLTEDVIDRLFEAATQTDGLYLNIDLQQQTITEGTHEIDISFEVDSFRKHCLVNGLDDIALTQQRENLIQAFEEKHLQRFPWLHNRFQ